MYFIFNHEIVIKLNLVDPSDKKQLYEQTFMYQHRGHSITQRTIHVKCAVLNCDSYAKKYKYKNSYNIKRVSSYLYSILFLYALVSLSDGTKEEQTWGHNR